jgi:hypothetical protein
MKVTENNQNSTFKNLHGKYADPWEESIGWDVSLNPLTNRFQDTFHS